MKDTEAKKTLLNRRAELTDKMLEIEGQLDETPTKDMEDHASERQGDEVLEALGRSDQIEVRRIDAALSRIERGTYGTCTTCGSIIDENRLSSLPETPFCRFCTT